MLKTVLLGDGASDRALLHVIRWTFHSIDPRLELAMTGFRRRNPGIDIGKQMRAILEELQPDVLFVHRDAEGEDPEVRRREIPDVPGHLVRVVPVRMTEAWLLLDEQAIRTAAGKPRGRVRLDLPPLTKVEALSDPKAALREALLRAAEVSGRRRNRVMRDLPALVQRVADLIEDFAPLRALDAFKRFEGECRRLTGAL